MRACVRVPLPSNRHDLFAETHPCFIFNKKKIKEKALQPRCCALCQVNVYKEKAIGLCAMELTMSNGKKKEQVWLWVFVRLGFGFVCRKLVTINPQHRWPIREGHSCSLPLTSTILSGLID